MLKSIIPVIAIAAIIGDDADIVRQYGINSLISVSGQPMKLDESVSNKVLLIKNSIKQFMRAIKTGRELKKN